MNAIRRGTGAAATGTAQQHHEHAARGRRSRSLYEMPTPSPPPPRRVSAGVAAAPIYARSGRWRRSACVRPRWRLARGREISAAAELATPRRAPSSRILRQGGDARSLRAAARCARARTRPCSRCGRLPPSRSLCRRRPTAGLAWFESSLTRASKGAHEARRASRWNAGHPRVRVEPARGSRARLRHAPVHVACTASRRWRPPRDKLDVCFHPTNRPHVLGRARRIVRCEVTRGVLASCT